MGLLQNGFRDAIGVFKFHGGGVLNGAIPQELVGNNHRTGRARNLTAGEGITSEQVGVPLGYGFGVAWMLPQKQGQMSARMYDMSITAGASGVMGFPIEGTALASLPSVAGTLLPEDDTSPLRTGSADLSVVIATADILPEDDASPLRTASATIEITAAGAGEMKSSGTGSTALSITVADAVLVGIFDAVGQTGLSITTNTPTLGAEASGVGLAVVELVASAWLLPSNDTPPARTASALISMSGSLTPYAVGNMIGNALPYTELSPQSLAQAVWGAPAGESNQAGTMGSKLNTASSGGVDMDALAEAVWEYTP